MAKSTTSSRRSKDSLKDQLLRVLPEVLPKQPSDAINGTALLKLVENRIKEDSGKEYSENSFRGHFSMLAGDPTSPIAKIDQGQGYYLRVIDDGKSHVKNKQKVAAEDEEDFSGRGAQREEKFRSLYIRWIEEESGGSKAAMHIEHLKSSRSKEGFNKWKFPDIVIVEWTAGEMTELGFALDEHLLSVKNGLGEPSFSLTSVELKVEITAPKLREWFFQCVSNSKWAHKAELVVACDISDEAIADELRRLGASYGVTVKTFGLTKEDLDGLPDARKLMDDKSISDELRELRRLRNSKKLADGPRRESLDWDQLKDLRSINRDIKDLFQWLSGCLKERQIRSAKTWRQMRDLAKSR